MKRVRIYLCIMIYVGLTCAKLVFPASAADLRSTVRSQIATDDRTAVYSAALLHRVSDPVRPAASEPYTVQTPLEQMEAARAAHEHAFFDYLPERQLHVEPSQAVAEELASAARLDAAYAAREAFLAEQAAFSDRAVPANVSFDITELPFQTVTPVAGVCSSGFGYRMHPIRQTVKYHFGTDFAAESGSEIRAFAAGTVLAAGQDAGYGNYVKLDHGDGYVTLYGHCSALLVQAGEHVEAGETIARVGATGQATGPHLHFELLRDGVYLNPEFYLAA